MFRDLCVAGRLTTGVEELDRVAGEAVPCLFLTPLDCYWEGSILQEPDDIVTEVDTSGCLPPNSPSNDENVTWGNIDFEQLRMCLQNSPESGYTGFIDGVCKYSLVNNVFY